MLGYDFGGLRRRFAFWFTAAIGGLLALGLSVALGLFDVKAKRVVPELQPGTPIAVGKWLVEVDRAAIAPALPDRRKPPPGRLALTVEARLTNVSGATSNDFRGLFKAVTPPPGLDAEPVLYLLRDGELLRQLHPGIGESIAAVWTLPETAPPASLGLALEGKTFKPRDNLYASAGWFDPHPVGRLTLPVAPRGEGASP